MQQKEKGVKKMKIVKLIQNETIKTLKKTSTKILIILSVVALLGSVGLSKLIMSVGDYTNSYIFNQEDWKEQMKEQISSLKRTLELEQSHYDQETISKMKAELEIYELALKYDINYYSYYNSNYWKIELLSEIQNEKLDIFLREMMQNNEGKEEKGQKIDAKIKLLENNDFSGYIEAKKQEAKQKWEHKEIEKAEYEEKISLLEIREKYGIYQEDNTIYNWKETVYQDITVMKRTLRTGINLQTGKLLKLEEIEELKDNLKIAEYRLEHDIPILESGSSARSLYDMFAPTFSLGFVAILMIMIVGASISTEISKGTIKFLLFTPNKRWKVLLSKIVSALIILVTLTLVLSTLTVLIGNLCFQEAGTNYVFVQGGEAKVLPNFVYTLLYFLISNVDIVMYMLFACMFSVLTRNTALSVGISIACYLGSGTIMQLINYYVAADWVKFVPFNNLGLADKVFANNLSYQTMQNVSAFGNQISIGFSLCVLAVCAILMLVTMFESFNKRDIM